MASHQQDVQALDRILLRLGLTEEDKLSSVLAKLLPLVIQQLKIPDESVRKKVLEILSHVNKRVKERPSIKLPLRDLLQLATGTENSPLVRNFGVVYSEMAFDRADKDDCVSVLPVLMEGITQRTQQHRDTFLRMLVAGLQGFKSGPSLAAETAEQRYAFCNRQGDREAVLAFLLKAPSEKILSSRKLGILTFLEASPLEPEHIVLHCVVAACDPRDPVSRLADDLLRKRCALDASKPAVDLEQRNLVDALFRLYLGSPLSAEALPAANKVKPASPTLQARVLVLMCKSKLAAESFPKTMEACQVSLQTGQPGRLRAAGMQFMVWVLQQSRDEQLLPHAQAVLSSLLSLLEETQGSSDAASSALRGFAYQAIGQLAMRAPEPFQRRLSVASDMFQALATEPPGVRASLQEAISCLASAYRGCSGDNAHNIELMLLTSITSDLDAARLCAAQWAQRLFPFSFPAARYICCLACGDASLQEAVGEAASDQASAESYLGVLEHALVVEGTNELHVAALEGLLAEAVQDRSIVQTRYSSQLAWLQGLCGHTDSKARVLAGRLLGIVTAGLSPALAMDSIQQLAGSGIPPFTQTPRFEQQQGSLWAMGFMLAQICTGRPTVSDDWFEGRTRQLATALKQKDAALASAAATALGHIGLRRPLPFPAGLLKHNDPQVASSAAMALGHIAQGDSSSSTLHIIVPALLGAAGTKAQGLMFAVGEAVSLAFGGVPVDADTILCTNFTSLADHVNKLEADRADAQLAQPASEAMEVDAEEGTKVKGRSDAQKQILDKILEELIFNSRPEVRCAGCVFLTSLVKFSGAQPALVARLAEVQEGLSGLLGDTGELTQELASQGLCAVYHLGDPSTQQALLDSLMGTLQGGPKKRRAVKVTGETEVFAEGQLGETPGGGSLTTYKELCALANDLGQPDLLYRFMDLANHAASVNSSRGAAFGLASIAKLAGKQLEPHLAALIPKLYRYQHDPNPRVREAMTHIWQALVPDQRTALDAHFNAIATDLLRELGGRLWRVREACCLSLADLFQGRRWPDLQAHFEATWTMALRALDDIKESVRAAAATLARTLRGLTLRLADRAQTPPGEALAAVSCTLPLLLEKGIPSSVKEVQGLALDTLAKMVKLARPETVLPHLPQLAGMLLESLSGMEDARLNYIEQHATRAGIDSEKLENLRVSASKASPLADTLDLCARIANASSLPELVPRLSQLATRGVGLNTRAGTARFIGQLVSRLTSDIKPHTFALIKALLQAARSERSPAVRRAFAVAIGQLAAYAPEPRTAKLAENIVELSSSGTLETRQLAGLLARELLRQARTVFTAHAASIMPLAFICRKDTDKDIGPVWGEVWEEGAASQGAALRLYLKELVQLVQDGLASSVWSVKHAAAAATSDMATAGMQGSQGVSFRPDCSKRK
ncbi:hypothetical protein WJX73_005986 [Symbiochloris irregularis]|uniref:Uncharacterized protein n=1 Tax=Symbiochloris irregularis TaxID=706552 RepID=A0AAW1NSS2_9CHLO